MPYLQYVFCDECKKAPLDVDYKATIEAYYLEGRSEKNTFVNPATIVWDYLVYRCTYCGKTKKYTFRDIELKVRKYFSELGSEYKEYFDKLDSVDFSKIKHEKPNTRKSTEDRLKRMYSQN